MNDFALTLDNVVKRYGDHAAVGGVSLRLPAGRCLALLGHNGAGKTTLMKLTLGLIRPTEGAISVLGCDPARAGLSFRANLGFLPENVAFHDEMTGAETLRFLASLKGQSAAECDRLLERVGLAFAAGRRVKTYSKGMRQRLGLAQALLGTPKLLLLDEPTTGLDPVLRVEFFEIIKELTEQGSTVILSSHILTELESRTDLIAVMRQGQLVAFGDLDDLRRDARLPVRIRLATPGAAKSVAQALGGLNFTHVNDHSVELACALPDKMEVLRHVTGLGASVEDVDIQLPTLDDLYLHYGHGVGATTGEDL